MPISRAISATSSSKATTSRRVTTQVYLKTLEGLQRDRSHRPLHRRHIERSAGARSDRLSSARRDCCASAASRHASSSTPSARRSRKTAASAAICRNCARHVLGEELALADAQRRWLGDPEARRELFAQSGPVHHPQGAGGHWATGPSRARLGSPRDLPRPSARQMKREIELHGATLVAEEKIGFSSAPDPLAATGLVPKPFAVRLFVSERRLAIRSCRVAWR